MNKVKGDLLKLFKEGKFDVICHGANCFCAMGSGIAAQIRRQFPEAFEADLKMPRGFRGKLGRYSAAETEYGTIVNAYTQYDYWSEGRKCSYKAIRKCFAAIKRDFSGKRIGYPMIGAGLAGGDWNKISKIIDEELEGEDHTLVIYER